MNPFRKAKPFLGMGDEMYNKSSCICNALDDASTRTQLRHFNNAVDMVMSRLGGFNFASKWIKLWCEKNGQPEPTITQIQEWRHRWLDHLADEWDAGIRK